MEEEGCESGDEKYKKTESHVLYVEMSGPQVTPGISDTCLKGTVYGEACESLKERSRKRVGVTRKGEAGGGEEEGGGRGVTEILQLTRRQLQLLS